MLAKLGFDRRAVWLQGAARPTRREVFQLLDPAGDIGVEIALKARFGNSTQPRDLTMGHPLTTPIESFHAHLDAGLRMMVPPIVQCFDVSFVKCDLDHLETPYARVGRHLTISTLT
jgi:hypothetical protein